jgi:hypothetical protein
MTSDRVTETKGNLDQQQHETRRDPGQATFVCSAPLDVVAVHQVVGEVSTVAERPDSSMMPHAGANFSAMLHIR